MTRRLMEGSEAIARAMVAAGCRFFAGYPMTPFTEVLEHMAKLLPHEGGVCINAESELEAIGMTWGAAATGARAATGSVGQGLSLMQESLAEMCFARVPIVVLNMARGQGDYYQSTRGGGHGDYHHIVLAPSSAPEAVELVQLAFHLADEWRIPVLLLGDYYLAHVREAVDVTALDFGPLPAKEWALSGASTGTGQARIVSNVFPDKRRGHEPPMPYGEWLEAIEGRIATMAAGVEPRVEVAHLDGAEHIVVAYGTPGRFVRYAVGRLREEGLPVGFVRPITLWPFPSDAVGAAARAAGSVSVYELNAGQMIDDVRLAAPGVPVEFIGGISFDPAGFGIAPQLRVRRLMDLIRAQLGARPAEETPAR
jgi:2-oxoglutarate ferredoxin oxidoreductase subunit alpha